MTQKQRIIMSILLMVSGIIGRLYAANVSYVDANGFLHDSIWLLFGSLLFLIGLLLLTGVLSVSLVKFIARRLQVR